MSIFQKSSRFLLILNTNSKISSKTIPLYNSSFLRDYVRRSAYFYCTKSSSDTASNAANSTASSDTLPKVSGKIVTKLKSAFTFDRSMKSFKYITPVRAMKEYMLKSVDLEALPKYYSRSPYSYEAKTLVYSRLDVENKAFENHGGQENFLKKQRIIKELEKRHKILSSSNSVSSPLTEDELFKESHKKIIRQRKKERLIDSSAGRVIIAAISINAANFAAKLGAWWITGSCSLFSEMLHSLADTLNQMMLAYGLHSSLQPCDEAHPYGYVQMRNISALISGVAIFCLGSGFSFYHGIQGFLSPVETFESLPIALMVMLGSFISEGATLAIAYNHIRNRAREENLSLLEFLAQSADPSTNVVLLEDSAAILGVVVASSAMALSYWTGSHVPDAIGAILVGAILSGVAGFIVRTNTETLIGRSIPSEKRDAIMRMVEQEKIIRGTYDIKATMIGADQIRFKAEVDVDGRVLTQRYLETCDLDQILKDVSSIESKEDLVHFMLHHGENIMNILGAEVNTIEDNIKKSFPTVKHIDIEIN